MSIRTLRFVTVLLAALAMAMKLTHAFELLPKLRWSPDLYLAVQTSLYRVFARVGPFLEVGALLAVGTLAVRLRAEPAFRLTLIALLAIFASLNVWLIVVLPASSQIGDWAATGLLPADWTYWRNRWQFGQAATFVLHLCAFSALIASILGDTPDR